MSHTLHITNGDSAAAIIEASSVDGEILAWRDPMHHGPFPANTDLAEISRIRAEYLAARVHNLEQVQQEFVKRDTVLMSASGFDDIILWFEHDLLDQLQILQILNWFYQNADHTGTPSLICIDRFDGIEPFRGIGQLNAVQMASLFDQRRSVTAQQLGVAHAAWNAFCAPDPGALLDFIATDGDALPFLKPALRRHLQEFPWLNDGLTRTERQLLLLVKNGTTKPGQLFVKNMDLEEVLFIGDWPTFSHIEFLCTCDRPLLSCRSGQPFLPPHTTGVSTEMFLDQVLQLTDFGRKVVAGEETTHGIIGRDFWLGGVHIQSGTNDMLWDNEKQTLIKA